MTDIELISCIELLCAGCLQRASIDAGQGVVLHPSQNFSLQNNIILLLSVNTVFKALFSAKLANILINLVQNPFPCIQY